MRRFALVLLLLLGAALPAAAEAPQLSLPLDCAMGSACFVQNYFDHDPGPGFAGFTCGPLGYDGHDGIDMRARTLADMEAGIAVLAAAPGVVTATRNDMEDVNVDEIGRDALNGKDAGNGVRIDHGDGWITQYSHMMKGSVTVHVGDHVVTGQMLGLMGLSGNTEFPHLHFSVFHDNTKLDPFTGDDAQAACGTARHPLWTLEAQKALAYVPGAALTAGFSGVAAEYKTAREGGYDGFALADNSPALVFWAEFFGVREGDHIRLTLGLPGDEIEDLADTSPVESNRASQFQFIGSRKPASGWPSGSYHGQADLLRTVDGVEQVVSVIEKTIALP